MQSVIFRARFTHYWQHCQQCWQEYSIWKSFRQSMGVFSFSFVVAKLPFFSFMCQILFSPLLTGIFLPSPRDGRLFDSTPCWWYQTSIALMYIKGTHICVVQLTKSMFTKQIERKKSTPSIHILPRHSWFSEVFVWRGISIKIIDFSDRWIRL